MYLIIRGTKWHRGIAWSYWILCGKMHRYNARDGAYFRHVSSGESLNKRNSCMEAVLRIRSLSRIQFFHPGSRGDPHWRIYYLSMLPTELLPELSEIWSGMFISDPGFFHPGKKHWIPDSYLQHCMEGRKVSVSKILWFFLLFWFTALCGLVSSPRRWNIKQSFTVT